MATELTPETLREAAELIRQDHRPCGCGRLSCPTLFFDAVAMLLDNEANAQDAAPADGPFVYNAARASLLLDVANSYIEGPA